jgi:hypothetical protein
MSFIDGFTVNRGEAPDGFKEVDWKRVKEFIEENKNKLLTEKETRKF